MNRRSFETTLRTLARSAPFRPFVVELVSGSRIRVDHPDAIAFNVGVAVHIAQDGTPTIFDADGVAQVIARQDKSKRSA
jgi:hypothetical protein